MQPGLRAAAGPVERLAISGGRIGTDVHSNLILADARATDRLAQAIAPHLRAGDMLGLTGGLGVGKSHFARALIGARLAALGREEEIPSPSYTLVQVYDLVVTELWHADLYRLAAPEEIIELGLDEAFERAINVVEWSDRLGPREPARTLTIDLAFSDAAPDARSATIVALGPDWDWLPAALDTAEVAA